MEEPDEHCFICSGSGVDYLAGLPCVCTWDGGDQLPGEDDGYEI